MCLSSSVDLSNTMISFSNERTSERGASLDSSVGRSQALRTKLLTGGAESEGSLVLFDKLLCLLLMMLNGLAVSRDNHV